ncbi:LTA synthase family protein [Lacticaseibacillus hulanensis]|uniref:LTA synthase family protein n=1 Tax=Lacticaseibacillus hulanensis TaxID=2493111 RepID=UPI000FD82098|nr:LTA synthase family protein [Lacticaseibacillus hulanensis]
MKQVGSRIQSWLNSRLGFFVLAIVLFWAKTLWVYNTRFALGVDGRFQQMLLVLNPLPATILLFGIGLYMTGRKSYVSIIIVDLLTSMWLFANVLYYREFSDFITFALMKGSSSVSNNLSTAIAGIIKPGDFLVFLDVAILILVLAFKLIRMDIRPIKKRFAMLVSVFAVVLFGANLSMAYHDRSGLLTRTFDNNYIVKYLGLDVYTVYDGVKTAQTSAVRAKASASDLKSVKKWINNNRIAPNVQYTGVAKGKNVFVIHLESFQQFLIDFKYDGKEVTPNLNKIYHANDTIAFDNFFNQVGQGKTSDAELMLENSLYGIDGGSVMSNYGSSNTFEAVPSILDEDGYTTAAFHGDKGSFWNRDNTYKQWGYDYWISKSYYDVKSDYDIGYGMKDKLLFQQSAQYIEQLPQPFYAKMITLTNHYPYPLDKKNVTDIPKTDTGDKTVDGYLQTAHYLDQSVGEFMAWLKKTGLDKNSLVMFYGDHYGVSGNHNKAMAKLMNIKGYNEYNDAQQQRVPLMFNMPGLKGGINHTYGGEIDVMPTLLNLLGVDSSKYLMFGNDLLAANRNQTVAFRSGNFVTPQLTRVGSHLYNTTTGELIKKPTPAQKKAEDEAINRTTTVLSLSDRVVNGDLLRFYKPKNYKKVDAGDYNYKLSAAKKELKKAQKKGTSLLAKNKGKSVVDQYVTDAPELKKGKDADDSSPSSSAKKDSSSSSSKSSKK